MVCLGATRRFHGVQEVSLTKVADLRNWEA